MRIQLLFCARDIGWAGLAIDALHMGQVGLSFVHPEIHMGWNMCLGEHLSLTTLSPTTKFW